MGGRKEFLSQFDCAGLEEKMLFELEGPVEKKLKQEYSVRNIRQCIESIDYTTLCAGDTENSVIRFVANLKEKVRKCGISPAAVCVFPNYASVVRKELEGSGIATAVVAASFPASQTFLDLKMAECRMAVEAGAQEIDVVLPVGKVLEGDFDGVYEELCVLRKECGEAVFKVILETGELKSTETIFRAALTAMSAGADFIKTSTGKVAVNATSDAVFIMSEAVRQYEAVCGKRVGIKVAGGVSSTVSAVKYRTIVSHVLGEEWITRNLFRIGSSKLFDDAVRSLTAAGEREY